MGMWINWGLVVAAIGLIVGDLILEVYQNANLAVLGLFLLTCGILGVTIDSATAGLGSAFVMALAYVVVHRRSGHTLPKHVSGN